MGIDLNNGFKELREHIGHDIVIVGYGDEDKLWNVAIECETCGCVLLDFDNEFVENQNLLYDPNDLQKWDVEEDDWRWEDLQDAYGENFDEDVFYE